MAKDKQPQMPESFNDLTFPARGVDLTQELMEQLPGTTPVGQNVRFYEPLTLRARGGSRPGLSKYIPAFVNGTGASKIQDLDTIAIVDSDAIATGGGFQPVKSPVKSFWSQRNANIRRVQKNINGNGGGAGPFTLAFNNPVTSGDLLLVGVNLFSQPTDSQNQINTITDTLSTHYTQINGNVGFDWDTNFQAPLSVFYGFAPSSGSNAVTIQPSGVDGAWNYALAILEYAGVNRSASPTFNKNGDQGIFSNSGDTLSSGMVSASSNSELIAFLVAGNVTPMAGLTSQLRFSGNGNLEVFDGAINTSTNATFTVAPTGGGYWVVMAVAFHT